MTVDTGDKIEVFKVEVEEEKCRLDMSSYEDLPQPIVGGDSKDDYVFVNGSDAASNDHGEGDCNGDIDVSESIIKVNGCDQLEIHNGEGKKLDNDDVKVEGVEPKIDVFVKDSGSMSNDPEGGKVDNDDVKIERVEPEIDVFVKDSDTMSDDHCEGGKLDNDEVKIEGVEPEIGVFVKDSDTTSDDHCEQDHNGRLNVSESNIDSHGRVDQLEIHSEEGDKADNEIKLDSRELNIDHGVSVETEGEGKVDGGVLVKDNGEIDSVSEVIVGDGQSEVENGGSNIIDREVDVNVSDSKPVEGSDTKTRLSEVKDAQLAIVKGDSCNSSVDGSDPSLDNGDNTRNQPFEDSGSQRHDDQGKEPETPEIELGKPQVVDDNVQPYIAEVPVRERETLGTDAKGSKPLDADVGHQSLESRSIEKQPLDGEVEALHMHDSGSQRHDDQGKEPETPEIELGKPQVVDDNVQPYIAEVPVRERETLGTDAKGSKPLDADVGHQSLESRSIEKQPLDGEVEALHMHECSELQPLDGEAKEPLLDNAIAENQCHQQELQPADGENKELDPVEGGTKIKEQCDLNLPEVGGNQELNSVNTFSSGYELQHSDKGEIKGQNETNLNMDHELQNISAQFEETENHSILDSLVDMPSDTTDKLVVDCEQEKVDGEEKSGLIAEVEESHGTLMVDQVAQETSSVDDIDKEVSGEDPGLEETLAVEEANTPSRRQIAEGEAVDEDGSNLDASHVGVGVSENAVFDDLVTDKRLDQVAQEAHSVDVIDKDGPCEGFGLEKTITADKVTNLSSLQSADVAAVEKDGSDLVADHSGAGDSENEEGSNLDATRVGVGVSENEVSDDLVIDKRLDQVAQEARLVDVIDKDGSSEDFCLEETITADKAANLSSLQAADVAAVEKVGSDLVAGHSGAADSEDKVVDGVFHGSQTIPMSSENSDDAGSCLRSEYENCNGTLPYPVRDAKMEVQDVNSEINFANKLNCTSNGTFIPKINFGSFECEAPFSHNDINERPEVLNRSIELTSTQSNITCENFESNDKPSNGIAPVNCEANGVHVTVLNHDKRHADVTDEVSASPQTQFRADAFDVQNNGSEVVRRPFYYLIRIPRYDDEKLKAQIRQSEIQVEEKTRDRDAVRVEYQKRKAACRELKSSLEASKSEERAARELVIAKKREIDSAQSLLNLARNAMTVEVVDSQILGMENKIQHETLLLNEEKQLIREIKQLKSVRDQLSANTRRQQEIQRALDQKVQVEENLKVLRKEIDALRDHHSRAEEIFKTARKKYDEESLLLNELNVQFRSADTIRQEAYVHLQNLRKQLSEKNKYFWDYKGDAKAAYEFAMAGNKDALERHCVNQVEKIMELWNKNDEFRKEYTRCNTRSTLRRFGTLDGRSLGPDEEAPSLRSVFNDRVNDDLVTVNSMATVSTKEKDIPIKAKDEDKSSTKVIEPKNKTVLAKQISEATYTNSLAEASGRIEIEEEKEERKPTKEEEELARKAEKLRREEEAIKLREQRKLEEKAKAQEALERKRRMAEKAQARAEFKARKEAEEKEKEKEKRAKKKQKKRGHTSDPAESEPSPLPESSSETIRESEITEKPLKVAKKSQKPLPYTKQIKTTKSIPPPLRNRGKRRMQQWLWVILTVVAVLALFLLGNSNFFRNNRLLSFGSPY